MKKKWLIVGVAVLIVGILAGYFIGQGGKNPGEKELGPFPGPQSAGSAPEIKYVPVAEAKGLEVEPKVVVEDWKQGVLSATVKIKNTRSEMLVTAKMTVTIDGQSYPSVSVNRLKAGETVTLNLEMLEVLNVSSIKKVEISFDPRSIFWASASSAVKEPKQTEELIYTAAPKNPKTPGEVVATFFFLSDQGRYAEAEALCTQKFIRNYGGAKQTLLYISQGKRLEKVEILKAEEGLDVSSNLKANIEAKLYFSGGGFFISRPGLIKENGVWKLYD